MTKFDCVTTSGNGMHVNENGGNRDSAEGKLDYTLLPIPALNRVVQHYVNGLKKYGRNNWHKLNTPADIERYKQSMFRHLIQYLEKKKDEDHLAAVVWNALALLFFEETNQMEQMETQKKTINPGLIIHPILNDILLAHFGGVPVYNHNSKQEKLDEHFVCNKDKVYEHKKGEYISDVNIDEARKSIEKIRKEILLERENTIATIENAKLLEVKSKQHIKSTLTITVDVSCENLGQVEKLLNSFSNDKSSVKAEIRFIKA